MRNAAGSSISTEQAADILAMGKAIKTVQAGEMRSTWVEVEGQGGGVVVLVEGMGDEVLLLELTAGL